MKNLKAFNFRSMALAICLGALSTSAAYARTYYACSTQSNGQTYQDSEYDRTTAVNTTLSNCQNDPNAYANDCNQYLSCQTLDDGQPAQPPVDVPANYACRTVSNGRDFQIAGRGTYSQMIARVVAACNQAYPYTNSYDCQANAYCSQ